MLDLIEKSRVYEMENTMCIRGETKEDDRRDKSGRKRQQIYNFDFFVFNIVNFLN